MPTASRKTAPDSISINRAPVLRLWAAVVAERLGYDPDEAASLGDAVSVLNARSKGRRLGIFAPPADGGEGTGAAAGPRQDEQVELLGRPVPIARTGQGVRATIGGDVINPQQVRRKLQQKFGDAYPRARETMEHLALSFRPPELAAAAYALYERFRPAVPTGTRGWGARGTLDLGLIRSLAKRTPTSTSTRPTHKGPEETGRSRPGKDSHPDRAGTRRAGRRTSTA